MDLVVYAMGKVDVMLPDTADSFGHVFRLGINDLNGQTARGQQLHYQLWAAIRQDTITAILAFAEKYPFTVTPAASR